MKKPCFINLATIYLSFVTLPTPWVSRMNALKSLLLLAIFQGLLACSSLPKAPRLPEFPLFNPADLGQNIRLTQLVTSQVNNQPQVMLTAWHIENGQMTLVGLTVTGQEILRLQYDGKTLKEEYNPLLNVPINGRTVISQIQFSYWPIEKIKQQLSGTAWHLLQDEQQRRITFNDKTVTTITSKTAGITPKTFNQYWPELLLESPHLKQNLTIKTISVDHKITQ